MRSGLIVPSTFETAVTATSFVALVEQLVERRRDRSRPSSVIGMMRSTAAGPLGQLMPGNEIRVVLHLGQQDFVAGAQVGVAPTAGHQIDALGRAVR